MAEIILKVDGMACEGCASAVRAAVERSAPGASATVDLAAKTVTIAGAPSRETIEKAITKAGYEIRG